MSGYVLAIVDRDRAHRVISMFRADETTVIALPNRRTFIYVSNSATLADSVIFQGYGVDHVHELMTFAGAAMDEIPDPSRPIEGSYFTARLEPTRLRCGADSYGFVSMAWTTDRVVTAVSDSFLALVAIRRALGLACTPDEESIRGRMWLNSMSLQQMGRESYCREIRYATPGTELRFEHDTGEFFEEPLDLLKFYDAAFIDHADAVTRSATRMVRTIKTYAAAGALVSLGLSGGTDSRLCLAAALAADVGDALHVASKDNGTNDFPIAVGLSEHFRFPLNGPNPANQAPQLRNDLLAGWAAMSAGLYDALYMPESFMVREVPLFSVAGHGAEISKGNFGWRPITSIGMPSAALTQSRRALTAIGADPDHHWGSEWHYLAFRNAIHGGRAVLSSDYVARPAAQIPLIGLSRSSMNDLPAPRKGQPSIVLDALIKISPELASIPFDDPAKNAPAEYIEARLQRIGGPLSPQVLDPYSIAGDPRRSAGILASLLDVARNAGFSGGLAPRDLLLRAAAPRQYFGNLSSEAVIGYLESIDRGATSRLPAASREAGAVGKMLALSTLM